MEKWQIYLIVTISVIVVLVGTFILYKFLKRKKNIIKDILDVKEIIELFGVNNIIGVQQTQKRVRIEVKDLSLVDLDSLNNYTNGIFTIGNKVVVTFKEKTEQIVKSLEALK